MKAIPKLICIVQEIMLFIISTSTILEFEKTSKTYDHYVLMISSKASYKVLIILLWEKE